MKLLLLFISFIVLSKATLGQGENNVPTATTYDIKDRTKKVIAKMTIIPGLRPSLVLKTCLQEKDSSGYYVTEFTFGRPNYSEAIASTIVLQFDKKIKDIFYNTKGQVDGIDTTIADDKSGTSFHASRLAAGAIVIVKIISSKPMMTTITGISGQMPYKENL